MIWLASFPRSGNTFARNVLHDVYGLESTEVNQKVLRHSSTYREYPVVKTHLRPSNIEHIPDSDVIVYLVRDGRDAIVSIAHHRSNIVAPGSDLQDNLKLAVEAQKDSYFGGWAKNAVEWMARADLVIRFEDLITDPVKEMEKLRVLVENLPKPNTASIPTFESQKKGDPKYGPPRNKNLFFRKGKVGDWKNTLDDNLESKFWKKAGAVMLLLGYSREGAVTAFEWTSRKEQKAKKLSRQFRSLSEWFRLFFPDRSRFIRNGHNQKISINPELIYFQAVSTNDPFLELAKSNLSPHQVGLIQLDENKKIKLTTLDENAVDDPAQLKMIISRVSRHYFSMIVEIKDDPIMISGVIDPIEHVVRKYSNLYPDTQVGDLTEVEHFLKFAKEFVNKNAQSRVISKFSRGLQFVWTPENYALKVKALCQRLGWSYKSPHLHDMSIPQSVRRELSGFNRKDLDLYHFFTSKSESHA